MIIKYNDLIKKINNVLHNNYPIKVNNLSDLSHFFILSNDWNKFLPFEININGEILSNEYKKYQIIKVITNKEYNWNDFILLYVSLLNKMYNPCIDTNKFIYLLHTYNFIDILNIKTIIAKKNNEIINININYITNKSYKLNWTNEIILNKINKINESNHFYFDSFSISNNSKKIRTELLRLFKNRDKFNNIHFHLDNNGGGDIVPAHLILRCLVGEKEKWMKNIKKIKTNKNIVEWDCWAEETKNNYNYDAVKELKLDLNNFPNYKTKYTGKIYLHMTKDNGSSAWFFITYLIYAFGGNITRYTKNCFGQKIKFGTINNNTNMQLILKGHSGTTSGDGNAETIKYKSINILCPTEQFISCSIKKTDWNRYWIQT